MTSITIPPWLPPLDDDCAVGLLRRMVEIPSPSKCEAEVASFIAIVMDELGYNVTRDAVGNVIGSIGPKEMPEIMLLGHMDTCNGELPVVLDAERLVGRGTVDAKGPLAAMVMAGARAAKLAENQYRVTVIGVVEEETPQSRGAMNISRTRKAPSALIIGEPSGCSAIVVGYKGKLDVQISARVPATHPTAPIDKAAELVARAWQRFCKLLGDDASHLAFDRPGATLTWIQGDLIHCEAEFSVRTPPGYDQAALVTKMRKQFPEISIVVVGAVAAVEVDVTNVVCRALRTAIRGQGSVPRLKKKTATSDMNILAERWKIPMATYGPGDSKLDHSDDEHITLQEYLSGTETLTAAVVAIGQEYRLTHACGPPRLHLVGDNEEETS